MLFKVIHGSFLLTLFLWVLWAAKNMLSKQAAALRNQWQTEARALLYVTFLVLIGFLFCAESFALQEKRALQVVPWLKTEEHFTQALAASGLFFLLSWGAFLFSRKVVPDHDPWLIPLSFLTCGIGLVFLYRLTPDIPALRGENDFRNLFRHQAMSFLLSLLVFMIALHYFTSRRIERLTRKRYLYVFLSVALISFTAVFGTDLYGRKLAVNLGGLISFQTVELVKMLALMFMVGYFRFEMPFWKWEKAFSAFQGRGMSFPISPCGASRSCRSFCKKTSGPQS